ncbi:MAG: PAS domain-containing protein [Tatlockia sp.]|nr:PAS domain-containing protein [Tatlockia sp.]
MKNEPLIQTLAQIIPSLPGCAWLTDNKGIYQSCNAEQRAVFGLSNLDNIVNFTHKSLPSFQRLSELRIVWETSIRKVIRSKLPLQFESCLCNPNGQIIRYQIIPLLDQNRLLGLLGISINDSSKSFHQIAVLKKILDNLPEHVYWKDAEGIYLGCNLNQALDLNLENSDAIIGKTDYELSPKALADAFRTIDQQVIVERQKIEAEEIVIRDNKPRVVLSKKIPLLNAEQVVTGILGISFDITELKETQKELRAAKEKAEAANYIMTEFIANIGHDLSTPISDVGSIAQLLDGYSDEYPELKGLFETLAERANACEAVRKSIINATSISNLAIKPEPFSIIEELLAIETALRPSIGSKDLKIIIHPLKPKKEDCIETDRTKFHEIIYDLMSNAINFTEKGKIEVAVKKENDFFHIEISDTGIGIPRDKHDYIFEQYTKLSRSNRYGAMFKGVGAGLYLARIRANTINGTIQVKSQVNKGSTFTLIVPVHPHKSS